MHFINYFLHMKLFTTLLVLTFQSKIVLLRGNIGTLLKLLVLFYWLHVFILLTKVHLINKNPSSLTCGLSPFENLYGYARSSFPLRVFGCTCFILHPHAKCNKLSSYSIICVFLGYSEGQKGYCCFDMVNHKLYVSHLFLYLEHPIKSHNVSKSELVHVDLFLNDTIIFL